MSSQIPDTPKIPQVSRHRQAKYKKSRVRSSSRQARKLKCQKSMRADMNKDDTDSSSHNLHTSPDASSPNLLTSPDTSSPNLPTSSGIPTDVTFLFANESGNKTEVKAHKQVLVLASEVFGREFFGSSWGSIPDAVNAEIERFDEENININISDASEEAFQVMINFVYNKQVDWSSYNLVFLSSLYHLAEKYHLKCLMAKIIQAIHDFWFKKNAKARTKQFPFLFPDQKVIRKNVLEVANLALDNQSSPELSEALIDVAAISLKKNFGGRFEAVLDFFSETEFSGSTALVIHKVMAKMKYLISPECDNCCHSPCLAGQGLTRDNFAPGARVTWVADKGHSQIDRLISVEDDSADQFIGCMIDGTWVNNLTLKPSHYRYNCY